MTRHDGETYLEVKMPAVRETYFLHPTTHEAGLWVETTSGLGMVGLARTAWPTMPTTGSAAQKLAAFQAALNAAVHVLFEEIIPLSSMAAADPRRTTPEYGCRIVGTNYIKQHTQIEVPVISISPVIVLGAITLTEMAARCISV